MKQPLSPVQAITFFSICILALLVLGISCGSQLSFNSIQSGITHAPAKKPDLEIAEAHPGPVASEKATASAILARTQVPILCYHQIRDWSLSDSKRAKDYIVPINNFREQMKLLADNGYDAISPYQLYNYLLKGS